MANWGSIWYQVGTALAFVTMGYIAASLTKLIAYIKNKKKKKKYYADFQKMSSIDIRLVEILSEMRNVLGASRSHVVRFHNKEHYFDGSSIMKASCTHESASVGVSHEIGNIQNILCSMIPELMEIIMKDNDAIYYTNNLSDGFASGFLKSQSIFAFAALPIYKMAMGSKLVVGFVIVHYLYEEDIPMDDNGKRIKQLKELRQYAEMIQTEILKG